MSEKKSELFKNSLKPSWSIFFLTTFFVIWQYFYSYVGFRIESLSTAFQYLGIGLGAINWNNYFIRGFSLAILWVVVAFIIFAVIWLTEFFSVQSHNRKIKASYLNKSPDDYSHLLKYSTISFQKHFLNRLLSTLPVVIFIIGAFIVSDLLEGIRFSIVDNYINSLIENNVDLNYNSISFLAISFIIISFVWYLYSGIIIFVNNLAKNRKMATEISDEHFVVVVDDEPNENEGDE